MRRIGNTNFIVLLLCHVCQKLNLLCLKQKKNYPEKSDEPDKPENRQTLQSMKSLSSLTSLPGQTSLAKDDEPEKQNKLEKLD